MSHDLRARRFRALPVARALVLAGALLTIASVRVPAVVLGPPHAAPSIAIATSVRAPSSVVAAPEAPFQDRSWRVVRIGGEAVPALDTPRAPYLRFESMPRRVQGATGCNTFSGGYEVNGDRLVFHPLIATRMHCGEVMAIEQALLKALGATRAWRGGEDRLELLDERGQPIVALEAMPR